MIKTIQLSVENMTCKHCVNQVNNAISSVGGVLNVDTHLETGISNIVFDDTQATVADLLAAVNNTDIYKAKQL